MKKTILTSAVLAAIVAGCNPTPSTDYTVTGTVADSTANGKTIYIMRYDDDKRIDSTVVRDNRFTFSGQVDTAHYCRINVTREEWGNLILEPGNIVVNLDVYNQPSGTPLNDELARIAAKEDSIGETIWKTRYEMEKQYTDAAQLDSAWTAYAEGCKEYGYNHAMEIFRQHSDDAIGYFMAVYSYSVDEFTPEQKQEVINGLGPWLKSTKRVREIQASIEAIKRTAEGQPFVDVKGKDINDQPAALSDYIGKGNYVLMDMWASWCGPCRGETPNLAKLHNRFKDKGLTVLGLFVWDKDENLAKAMEEEHIDWPQIIDSEKNATTLYGVEGIPHIILFAPDGTILKRDLRGDHMIQTVTDFLTGKQQP